MFLDAKSPRSRCWQVLFLKRPLSLLSDGHLLALSSHGLSFLYAHPWCLLCIQIPSPSPASFSFSSLASPWHIEFLDHRSYLSQLWSKPQLWQCQILNPLCKAGIQTCVPTLQRCRWSCCAKLGIPQISSCKNINQIGLGPTLFTSLKVLSPNTVNTVTFWATRGRASAYEFWRTSWSTTVTLVIWDYLRFCMNFRMDFSISATQKKFWFS